MIAKSPLARNVTIKGGVVMQHLSGTDRRATQDLDFDFIRYSINDDSIGEFIKRLNTSSENIAITIIGDIEELKHRDYQGKRVRIQLIDSAGTAIDTKLDIGVHRDIDAAQEEYCFDLSGLDDSVTLFVNTKEQIVAEKLKTLLRLGQFSTRYKDIFDLYYLLITSGIDGVRLYKLIKNYIFDDTTMHENSMTDVNKRMTNILSNRRFVRQLSSSRKNWLNIPTDQVIVGLMDYFVAPGAERPSHFSS
jgi:hypothetical protein